LSKPYEPFKLDPCAVIVDVDKFLSSHLDIVKSKNGESVYSPYWERLLEFKKVLENGMS